MTKKFILFSLFLTIGIAKNSTAMNAKNHQKKRKIDAISGAEKLYKNLSNKKQKIDILTSNITETDIKKAKKILLENPVAFHHACRINNLNQVKLFISADADVNMQIPYKEYSDGVISSYTGRSPLHIAIKKNNSAFSVSTIEIIKLLIKNGADVNDKTYNNLTPLNIAIASSKNKIEIVKLLIENGANINHKTNKNYTPLITAITHYHINIAYFLIASGADYNIQDKDGGSALHHIVSMQSFLINSPIFKNKSKKITPLLALLIHLSDTKIKNNDNKTAQELLPRTYYENFHDLFNKELFNNKNEEILTKAFKKLKKNLPIHKYGNNITTAFHTSQIK